MINKISFCGSNKCATIPDNADFSFGDKDFVIKTRPKSKNYKFLNKKQDRRKNKRICVRRKKRQDRILHVDISYCTDWTTELVI